MTISLEELIGYWQGELGDERAGEIEEAMFSDASIARRLDAVRDLSAGVRALVAAGRVQAALSVAGVGGLEAAGLAVRTYQVSDGAIVPCTIAREDFVAIRLRGDFAGNEHVDVVMDGTFEGMPPAAEQYRDVPVDRAAGEIVLLYPGDRIRALPRSQFCYRVASGGHQLGEFRLDHRPPEAAG